jgi:hypothetical protein
MLDLSRRDVLCCSVAGATTVNMTFYVTNSIGILKTKFNDREGHEALLVGR